MFRTLDVIMICAVVAGVAWTFKVKNDAQVAVDRVSELEEMIAEERAQISLLRADWSLYTTPSRLQKLVEKYQDELKLKPLEPGQIADRNQMPRYRADRMKPMSPLLDGFAEVDRNLNTGSVPLVGGTPANGGVISE